MNTLEAITTQRSIRRFLEKPVENHVALTDPAAKETEGRWQYFDADIACQTFCLAYL